MKKDQTQFIKIQPFIQTLRPSLHLHKDSLIDPPPSNHLINNNQILNFNPREKSLSKSKILRVTRKNSVGTNLKYIQKNSPECTYSKNQLEINFKQIFDINSSSQSFKALQNSKEIQNGLDIKEVKISVVLSNSITENIKQGNYFVQQNNLKSLKGPVAIKIKLEITCFELSIEDQSNVKRIFDINLTQTLKNKQFLKIQISQGFKPELLIVNKKLIIPKEQAFMPPRQQAKVGQIKPWQLANQRKSLLQNKILSERPKSKIKWSFSLTQSSENVDIYSEKLGNVSEFIESYGLKNSQENALKFSLELKSRSHLNLNMPKQNPYINVFSSHVKQEVESNSMISTFDSDDRSSKKQHFGCSNQLKRINNMRTSYNFKDKKLKVRQDYEEEQKTQRPKSSFKSLKEKNDYFQMKESERKKSLKKNAGCLMDNGKNRIEMKSSQIKQEYGIS